jgi:two-component system sensor histidine kinase VicK
MLAVILGVTVLVGAAIAGWFLLRRSGSENNTQTNGGSELLSKQIQTETLIQSITDGVIVTDTQDKISLFNKAACAMTEWPAEEALGIDAQTVIKILADEKSNTFVDNANHPFNKVIQTRTPVQETVQLVSRGNKKLFISLAISPIIIPKKEELVGTVAVFRDVSREKSEEQQRAEFVSTASHEMRTPVAAIEGYLALALNDKVSQIDARAREYLEKAHSSTQHLGKLFQDLLTSAKAEDGRLTSHPVVTEMGTFIENLAQDLRFAAEKKGLQMEFLTNTISPETGGVVDARGKVIQPLYYVHVDPDRIREVVTNVFDNAVKYTDDGKVSLGITGNNEIVQVRVSDTGPGIPTEDLEHLFQKFYRVDNSATRSVGGTGLGLFICKKIVELYHGTIWAESEVSKGSTFYINIPRLNTQRAHQLQEAEKANPTT